MAVQMMFFCLKIKGKMINVDRSAEKPQTCHLTHDTITDFYSQPALKL